MSPRSQLSRSAKTNALTKVTNLFEAEVNHQEEDAVEKALAAGFAVAAAVVEPGSETEQSVLVVKPPKPVFRTFKTNAKLEQGLCIVHSLGGGRYEVINLKKVDSLALGTEEFANRVKNAPGILKALDIDDKDWQDAQEKVTYAVRNATGNIFRFMRLPPELRFKIYEMCVLSPKGIQHNPGVLPGMSLSIRQTCRQIFQETDKFFWRNNFMVHTFPRSFGPVMSLFTNNVVEVTFTWYCNRNKDAQSFGILGGCKNLKVLNLLLTHYIGYGNFDYRRPQFLHQHNNTIKKFRTTFGFDSLCRIRGLERVTVGHQEGPKFHERGPTHLNAQDVTEFEKFLNAELIKPKPKPVVRVSRAAAKKAKSQKKARGAMGGDDDFRP